MKLTFDKRKTLVGALLAAAVLVLCAASYSWKAGLVFGMMYLLAGVFRIQSRERGMVLNYLWGVACIVVTFYASRVIDDMPKEWPFGWDKHVLNILCIAIVCGLVYFLTAKWRFSVTFGTFAMMFLTTVNNFIYLFRGKELVFMDIFSVKTALNVAGQYDFAFSDVMVYGWLLWGVAVFCQFLFPKEQKIRWWKPRAVTLAAVALLSFAFSKGCEDLSLQMWGKDGCLVNGYYVNFYISIRDGVPRKPDGYSEKAVEQLEEQYEADAQNGVPEDKPNIIVIMSESFADLRVLGDGLNTNQSVMPNLDALQENTIRGYALASVFGGSTPNSEFEFLTGHTLGHLPKGAVPYQQFIEENMFTMTWLMEDYGYQSFATHPYLASGWSRTKIYPMLGFREFTFMDDYPQQALIRDLVSDREMYDYVLNRLENRDPSQPLFLFGITMQNHGGYNYPEGTYEHTIALEGYSREYPGAEQYLSLVRESDEATGEFLKKLEAYPEDTIVLFFGDHLPQLDDGFFEEVHGGTFDTLDEQQLQYTVPFFIWANFDIPEYTLEQTSLSYLGLHLMEAAGLPLTSYYRFLSEMEQVIPAMNAHGYYSKAQGAYLPFEEAEGEEKQWLDRHAILQYNNLLDGENRSRTFFSFAANQDLK